MLPLCRNHFIFKLYEVEYNQCSLQFHWLFWVIKRLKFYLNDWNNMLNQREKQWQRVRESEWKKKKTITSIQSFRKIITYILNLVTWCTKSFSSPASSSSSNNNNKKESKKERKKAKTENVIEERNMCVCVLAILWLFFTKQEQWTLNLHKICIHIDAARTRETSFAFRLVMWEIPNDNVISSFRVDWTRVAAQPSLSFHTSSSSFCACRPFCI